MMRIHAIAGNVCGGIMQVLTILLLGIAAVAQQRPAPAPPLVKGEAVNPSDTDSGFYFGTNWMIYFTAPHAWPDDAQAARALGVIGVVHPRNWDPKKFAPVIYLAMDQRTDKVKTLQDEIEADVAQSRQNDPHAHITRAASLVDTAGHPVEVRIFDNGRNWQEVAYLDQPPAFLMVTLRCVTQAACRAIQPDFARFVKSLRFIGNVHVIDHTQQDHAQPPAPPE